VAIDGILSSGLSAIMTNSAALKVTADNISNVNTPGYSRRVAQLETQAPGGELAGVKLASIERVVSTYFDREALIANGTAARYDVQSQIMSQLDGALGRPGDGESIGSKLDALYASLGQASLDPSSLASRLGTMSQFQSLAQTISNLAGSVATLRGNADEQISSVVSEANSLIQQIYQLNPQIQRAMIGGDTSSGLLDQRDQLVQQLAQLVGIRTSTQADGRMFVATTDGLQLVSDNYAQLSAQPSAGPSFNPVTIQTVSGTTGQPIGTSKIFDPHASAGQLRGLLDMRDGTLVGIGEELGQLAQSLSLAFNAVHNSSAAVPPPSNLTGRGTGLLDTDALNFSGATTIGVTDSSGTLLHKIAIDFDAGTLSVDGGGTSGIGGTIGSFVSALDSALGGNGTASFTDGVLTLSANGGNGLVVADDSTNPSSRGGVAFSQFFGLNDLFQANANAVVTTGLSASDTAGFAPGGGITLMLKGPQGDRVGATTVGVTGTTIGDMVTALNTAFTGKATFTLDANGQLQVTPASQYTGYQLEVSTDTTQRGSTGESFSSLFGLGTGQAMARAQGFSLASGIQNAPERISFAQPLLTAATALGSAAVTPGDNRGLLALQNLFNQPQNFAAAGGLPSRTVTLGDYTAAFYQDAGGRSAAIDASKSAEDTRLQLAQQNQSKAEGVNLDEELEKMMVLQQAYNAGTRLISVAQQLYQELLNAVGN
jgi:flagellar hook-associated protein 1 FlgK